MCRYLQEAPKAPLEGIQKPPAPNQPQAGWDAQASRWDLRISKGGDSTASLENLGQWFTNLTTKNINELIPRLRKQPNLGKVSPAELNLQPSLTFEELLGELPALPFPAPAGHLAAHTYIITIFSLPPESRPKSKVCLMK